MIPYLGLPVNACRSTLAQADGSLFMPPQASSTAPGVDWLFSFILYIACFFFLLIVVLMVLFTIRYLRRPGRQAEKTATHNLALELTWTLIPVALVIAIFYIGFTTFMDMITPPDDAYEVLVTGQKWNWLFQYPNGYVDSDLHVPVDVPVLLVMTSEDVIHSFYIPAFRVKRDVVPGRYNKTWFHATQPGEYTIFCAEYCGTKHSDMLAQCVVHKPGEFERWLENASNFLDRMSPADAGRELYKRQGCAQCHSTDGSVRIGPTLKNLFARDRPMRDGSTLPADENYLREAILEPQAAVVAGFESVMPTYKGRLKDREITAIIEYIKTLSD
ncbi:MAG: cytochrome c oxidase subunit II [Phycisphaerales bacterium]|nr:MAG: cytochrome c oxidase subunit II [Phycisphaerales bacterium]